MRLLRSTIVIMSIGALATAGGVAVAQDSGESAKDANAIMADAAHDLAQVKSYHFAGRDREDGVTSKLTGDALANGSGRFTLTTSKEKAQFVELPGVVYIKANAAFWRTTGEKLSSNVVRKLANRWIRQKADKDASIVSEFAPKKLAACLTGGTGTLSKAGTATIAGQQALVIEDAGDKPGTTPSRYYLTSKPPILLLRAVQTGKPKPGTTKDKSCSDDSGDDDSTSSDLAFSRFNKVPRVTAPHGAVTPEQAVRGTSGQNAPSTPA